MYSFQMHSSVLQVLRILPFINLGHVSASSIFRPNCTRPPDGVNFVYKADIRGTFDILWSCLFTLLVCTWTVQHLNIPDQRIVEGDVPRKIPLPQKFYEWAVKKLSHFVPKLKWMLLTLLLPEFLLGKAFQDRILAERSRREMEYFAKKDSVEWTLTHSFYANMGGFVLKAKKRHIKSGSEDATFYKAHVFLDAEQLYLARGGEVQRTGKSVLHKPILRCLPSITQEEIEDKSKGDFFIKTTALVQVLWLLIQVIIRAARRLIVSQLEIVVLAYSVCTIITYLLCWSKPQGTQIPTVIRPSEPVTDDLFSDEGYAYLTRGRPRSWFATSLRLFRFQQLYSKRSTQSISTMGRSDCLHPLPNDGRYDRASSLLLPKEALQTLLDDGFAIGGLVFGALHCSAWNFPFPTPVERLLWRIASVLSTGIVPLYYMVLLFDFHIKRPRFLRSYLWLIEGIVVLSYVFARLYLLVEVFRSLCFLPPDAFLGNWTQQIPHVS